MYYDSDGSKAKTCGDGSNKKPESTKGNKVNTESGKSTSKPNQVHHFASNKNKTYKQQFKDIVSNYGLDLDGDWNKESLPHQGRHTNAYHNFILDKMQEIDKKANGDKDVFLDLFKRNIKDVIIDNSDMLYKKYWKNLGRK